MIKTGKLIYEYPDKPAHPQQAYKTPDADGSFLLTDTEIEGRELQSMGYSDA